MLHIWQVMEEPPAAAAPPPAQLEEDDDPHGLLSPYERIQMLLAKYNSTTRGGQVVLTEKEPEGRGENLADTDDEDR